MIDDGKDRLCDQWHARKSAMMSDLLGDEHPMVLHAIVPFAAGGRLDLHYYPQGIPGTAIATKELCETPDTGPSNAVFDRYELVMFTRHSLALEEALDESTPFGRAHRSIDAFLNCLALFSAEATLNPGDTCEFPAAMKFVGGRCLIFDAIGLEGAHCAFGLLLAMEIYREEMEFAREHRSAALFERLKNAGYYPYSDLDRPRVV